jgi:hypothetical protein
MPGEGKICKLNIQISINLIYTQLIPTGKLRRMLGWLKGEGGVRILVM